jgi:hypothetical protein
MRTPRSTLSSLMLLCGTVVCLASTESQSPSLTEAMNAVASAWESGDRATLEGLLTTDFVHVDGRGHVQDRDEFISNASQRRQRPSEVHELRVKSYGDVAIVTGERIFTPPSGAEPSKPVRFIQVWKTGGDRWVLSIFQVTPVGAPPCAAARRPPRHPRGVAVT